MSDQECNTQRELGYRAVIPFYILWDTDLNGNDLRFYGQIEQLESNPNPNVNATFSYQWMGDQLGITRRNAINIATKLKKKGYINRTRIKGNSYLWNTVKKGVLVSPSDTPLVSPSDTQNIMNKNKAHKITTTTKSGGNYLSKSKQKKLGFKCKDDPRDDEEFLENCEHHIKNNSTGTSQYQRTIMLFSLLKKLLEAGEHFKSKGFVSAKEQESRMRQEAENKRIQDEYSEKRRMDMLEAEKSRTSQEKNNHKPRSFAEIMKRGMTHDNP